jgi:hypothetical protein
MLRAPVSTAIIAATYAVVITGAASSSRRVPWPWEVNWHQTGACQDESSPCFAPPGCFTYRWVRTPHTVARRRLYVCR